MENLCKQLIQETKSLYKKMNEYKLNESKNTYNEKSLFNNLSAAYKNYSVICSITKNLSDSDSVKYTTERLLEEISKLRETFRSKDFIEENKSEIVGTYELLDLHTSYAMFCPNARAEINFHVEEKKAVYSELSGLPINKLAPYHKFCISLFFVADMFSPKTLGRRRLSTVLEKLLEQLTDWAVSNRPMLFVKEALQTLEEKLTLFLEERSEVCEICSLCCFSKRSRKTHSCSNKNRKQFAGKFVLSTFEFTKLVLSKISLMTVLLQKDLLFAVTADFSFSNKSYEEKQRELATIRVFGTNTLSEQEESNSEDSDTIVYKDLDGNEIPFWLFKRKGLHRINSCEVCGEIKYPGKEKFNKHFQEAVHKENLKTLGIEDYHPYKYLNRIQEVLALKEVLAAKEKSFPYREFLNRNEKTVKLIQK